MVTTSTSVNEIVLLSPLTLTGSLNPWAIFLLELWDEIGYSEADRSEFKAINVNEDGFTNDLLTQHKMEAEKLSAKLETMRHILEVRQVVPFIVGGKIGEPHRRTIDRKSVV